MIDTPERSRTQRMSALEEANRIRKHRARLKRDLKAGRTGIDSLLTDRDCDTMKLVDALIATPKIGRVKAKRILDKARISPSRTLGGLSSRQRGELADRLGVELTTGAPSSRRGTRLPRERANHDLLADIARAR